MTIEPVDFCRVKKIDEKGFGFLRSVHYQGDVFFHFSQIKREELLTKLAKLKRGDFFLFFTSKMRPDHKRKVDDIWYEVGEIPEEKIPGLVHTLVREFETGRSNLYDLFFLYSELKKKGHISPLTTQRILDSEKILHLPTTILPYLMDDELKMLLEKLNLDEIGASAQKPFWFDEMRKAEAELKERMN